LAVDPEGLVLAAYRLYDRKGSLVAESSGLEHVPDGLTIRCRAGELLLSVPRDSNKPIRYRLYNRQGTLLTSSDGGRTMIYGLLRMGRRDQKGARSD
jgi:hypothetical protein